MSTLKRIKEYIDYKGINNKQFEESVGFSNGSFSSQLKNNRTIGVDKLENILSIYTDINTEWLLTGNGNMLKSNYQQENTPNIVAESKAEYKKTDKDKYIDGLERENNRLIKEIERLHSEIDLKDELLHAFRTGQIVYAPHTSESKEKDAG